MSKRVLVIDDEEHIREVAATTLEVLQGWEVMTASGGHEGIAQAAAEHPDLILLDMMMPDLDGVATVGRLQANEATRDIPVILLTAKVREADRDRFRGLGFVDVMAKPFDPLRLGEQVAAALGWQ